MDKNKHVYCTDCLHFYDNLECLNTYDTIEEKCCKICKCKDCECGDLEDSAAFEYRPGYIGIK
ncbi:hypothetical protein [Clostridium sp.]|uniref:hypothetical protein n=1 Tax=Clostridium sp. TaxID=1506 RepID=UPI001A43B447|nr:hypothetical protein [Clostridium sp.]MBK5239858.1 hypothetical protein [Clostridium sp.]